MILNFYASRQDNSGATPLYFSGKKLKKKLELLISKLSISTNTWEITLNLTEPRVNYITPIQVSRRITL